MPLTTEEIAEITTAFEKGETPAALKSVSDIGWMLQTPTQHNQFKETYKGQVIKDHDAIRFNEFESAVKEASGLEKLPNEKATDFAKRAITSTKSELQDLRDKKDDGTATKADKERINTLEGLLKTEKENTTKTQTTAQAKLLNFRVSAEMGVALAGIRPQLVKSLAGDALNDVLDARTARFRTLYKSELVEDATDDAKSFIQYRDAKTNEIINKAGTATPATADEIMRTLFDSYIDKGHSATGAGAGKGKDIEPGKGGEPITADGYVMPDTVKTRVQLSDDLKKSGIKAGTADYTTLLKKHGEGLPLGR